MNHPQALLLGSISLFFAFGSARLTYNVIIPTLLSDCYLTLGLIENSEQQHSGLVAIFLQLLIIAP